MYEFNLDPGDQPHRLIEHANAYHSRVLLVDWMLGNSCSYACSYCPKVLHSGSVKWQRANDVLAFYDQLELHYVHHRQKQVMLQFTGGEPTMHPQIIKFLSAARSRGFSTSLISNASRTHRFWEKIRPSLDAVILTYHSEFAIFDHFHGVCEIVSNYMPVHINITMRPEVFDETLNQAEKLRVSFPKASISLKPLRVDFGAVLWDYSQAQLDIMAKGLPQEKFKTNMTARGVMCAELDNGDRVRLRPNEIVTAGLNCWKGYSCNAGLESLRITGDGAVSRATCFVGGVIGHLGIPMDLPIAPITCTMPVCGCTADILITKRRCHAKPFRLG